MTFQDRMVKVLKELYLGAPKVRHHPNKFGKDGLSYWRCNGFSLSNVIMQNHMILQGTYGLMVGSP